MILPSRPHDSRVKPTASISDVVFSLCQFHVLMSKQPSRSRGGSFPTRSEQTLGKSPRPCRIRSLVSRNDPNSTIPAIIVADPDTPNSRTTKAGPAPHYTSRVAYAPQPSCRMPLNHPLIRTISLRLQNQQYLHRYPPIYLALRLRYMQPREREKNSRLPRSSLKRICSS